jgi:hypothetical protein
MPGTQHPDTSAFGALEVEVLKRGIVQFRRVASGFVLVQLGPEVACA